MGPDTSPLKPSPGGERAVLVTAAFYDNTSLDVVITIHPIDNWANSCGVTVKSVVKVGFCNRDSY